jgi:hypothetical protein
MYRKKCDFRTLDRNTMRVAGGNHNPMAPLLERSGDGNKRVHISG